MNEKRCHKCGDMVPLDEMTKDKRMPDGHTNYCKKCVAKMNRECTARSLGYGNWDPLKLIDDIRFGTNMEAMELYKNGKLKVGYRI